MSILDSILPAYAKVSEAPTLDKIKKEADLNQVDLSQAIREESTKKYKAITDPGTPSAAVWLVSNPALLAYQYEMGAKTLTRKPPSL